MNNLGELRLGRILSFNCEHYQAAKALSSLPSASVGRKEEEEWEEVGRLSFQAGRASHDERTTESINLLIIFFTFYLYLVGYFTGTVILKYSSIELLSNLINYVVSNKLSKG